MALWQGEHTHLIFMQFHFSKIMSAQNSSVPLLNCAAVSFCKITKHCKLVSASIQSMLTGANWPGCLT